MTPALENATPDIARVFERLNSPEARRARAALDRWTWARRAAVGEYLLRFKGRRLSEALADAGIDDEALEAIYATLRLRRMALRADERGLIVVWA